MQGLSTFEQALQDFSILIAPFQSGLDSPESASLGTAMIMAYKPFFILFGLNVLTFCAAYYVGKVTINLLDRSVSTCIVTLGLARSSILRTISRDQVKRLKASHNRKRTQIIEDQQAFDSWETVAQGTIFSTFRGNLTNEAKQALAVLGIHAFATEGDLRKAYLDLMKKYHPDRFMNEPSEWNNAQNVAVKIREAYDVLSKQFCQVQ